MNDHTKIVGLEKGAVDSNSPDAQDRFFRGYAGGNKGGVDLGNRTIDGVASTIQLDRDGEVILPEAFRKHLGRFLDGNAPFLNAHQHRSIGPSQIGWVMEAKIHAEKVSCRFRFKKGSPDSPAQDWWELASDPDGKGIAFSVGFIPIRWVAGSVADLVREFPQLKKVLRDAGLKDEDRIRVYTEIELLEISAVPVGSNREALQIRSAMGETLLEAKHASGEINELAVRIGELEGSVDLLKDQQSQLMEEKLLAEGLEDYSESTETPTSESSETASARSVSTERANESAGRDAGSEASKTEGLSLASKSLLAEC